MSDKLLERVVANLELLGKQNAALQEQLDHTKQMHEKAPGNFGSGMLLTQPGGMFSVAGIEQNVVSTHVTPMGLGAALPAFASNIDDPRYGFLTGFSDDIGDEATLPCDDAPYGYMKSGLLTATFGRIMRQTQTIEIDKILHQKRGASTDLRLLGSVIGNEVGLDVGSMDQTQILNLVVNAEMVNVGVLMERKLGKLLWQGAITNNTAGGGYKAYPGLDNQIATGQVEAETNTAMPAADSFIMDFNYSAVDGVAKDIVEYLSMMEYYLYNLAQRTNMLPIRWAVVMRPELWFELSAVWPCRYLTHRCTEADGTSPMVINDDNNVRMRDQMRDGKFIDVNGRRYPVIEDDGIFEHTNVNNANVPAGSFASAMYFVPLVVRGNFPVTYYEYIDYRGVQAQLSAMGAGARNVPFWSDNGKFLWVYRDNSYCFDLQAKIEPRVVLRTPHLAGKMQNVLYSPLAHLRDSDPASSYWKDGGVSFRSGSTNYAVWGNFTV